MSAAGCRRSRPFSRHRGDPAAERVRAGNERDARKYELSDLILVPSEFVRRAVLELGGDPERIATVPYGLDESWLDQIGEPVPGRVLFVGSVGLRKGSHYLAAASRILERRRVACEVRVVGPYQSDAVSHPAFNGPTYVGQVPRSRVMAEFRRADVFVLPTLCDSFALVHLEAMACGVPVITTPNCGSVVRDGVDGFIVPIRDPEAIADKIELLLADRALRERMGRSARARAGSSPGSATANASSACSTGWHAEGCRLPGHAVRVPRIPDRPHGSGAGRACLGHVSRPLPSRDLLSARCWSFSMPSCHSTWASRNARSCPGPHRRWRPGLSRP